MHPFVFTANPAELAFISGLDYGQDKARHYAELNKLVFEHQGKFKDGEFWFPLEVIELGANSIKPGHEREFVICCLLVLSAIDSGHCLSHDRESKYAAIEPMLFQLPDEFAGLLMEAYAADY
ncbi:hypothetical protein SAMN05518865_1202 [Duganella sp. CF458]|uniref:hypothetical protein n=1 Tax=Duganella sp. CF458 TaxID=1884368 RepID=UPI0008EB106F|nr:hypothetical protein [Duganella sp. CF458]SFG83783.1 hypothetical protein SAMN05518865_1202 [Duganella sp. CF458]